ncbi:MAG: pantoate--beta-alanine ligase, partial [Alphaproteobacteria bacterium]
DYQQLCVIRRFVRDLDIPVDIRGVPTVREADGLALSSRNAYLDAGERAVAPALYRALVETAGELAEGADPAETLERARAGLADAGFDLVEYLELRAADDLAPLDAADRLGRLLAAAWLGGTRLIDNVSVPVSA